nr:BACON domain-containing protein [uncultured Draconibacterium sp.]
MKRYILILLWIFPYLLNAQDLNPYSNIIPPNPDAASLAKYADFPVDLSSGVPQISIPLWSIKCGDINVPISLSYHASGIPVAETPSYVGLGWTLNAGGAITRTIRGTADDGMQKRGMHDSYPREIEGILTWYSSYAVYPNFPSSSVDNNNPYKYREAAAGKRDLEPDMFYYNFCSFSGKFVFDFNGNSHLIPRKNIIIEKELSNNRIIKWVITTDDGLKYYFEEFEKTEQNTKAEAWTPNGDNLKANIISNSLTTSEHNSAWFLSKIEMPNSSNSIVFVYDDITQENTYPVSETYKVFNGSKGGTPLYSGKNIYEETQTTATINGKRLSKIIAPDQTIEFISGDYRHDLKGDKVLDDVVIKNAANEIIKQFKLSYNYFSGSGMTTLGTANPDVNPKTYLRLSLKKIQELDKNGNKLPPYTFEYENSVWLPDRLTSKAQDHWGYYNGEDENTSLIPYLNSIRDASADDMKAGSLVKIKYPTGGYTQFVYEANDVSTSVASMSGSGLRIKEKVDYDPVSNKSLIKQYDYNLGFMGYTPAYFYNTSNENTSYINYTSSSNSALNNGGEEIISYKKVSVIEGNDEIGINGKTENEYTYLQSYNHYPVYYDNNTDNVNLSLIRYSNMFPFAPAISGAWGSGLLKIQTIYKYKNNSYSKIKSIMNTYKNDYWGNPQTYNSATDVLAARAGVISTCSDCIGADEFGVTKGAVQFYFIPSRNINLTKTIETDYDDNENPIISKVTEIEYENSSPYIYRRKITTTNSNGVNRIVKYRYPKDLFNGVYPAMKNLNMLNYPVEKTEYINSTVVASTLTTYKYNSGGYVPYKVYSLETSSPLISFSAYNGASMDSHYNSSNPEVSFDKYDSKSNPTQIKNKDGIIMSYLWDATGSYLMARIENATYNQVSSQDGKSCTYDSKNFYNSLKNLVPGAMITTYSYKTLMGLSAVTDPKGVTQKYDYDTFGRLHMIKNDDEHIVNLNYYHYFTDIGGGGLEVNPSSLHFNASGGSASITISSNASWTVSENADWIFAYPLSGSGNGTITVPVNPNSTGFRTSVITILSNNGVTKTVYVFQD